MTQTTAALSRGPRTSSCAGRPRDTDKTAALLNREFFRILLEARRTRKRLSLGTGEADPAVALGVGPIEDRLITPRCQNRLGRTERAQHITVLRRPRLDGADIHALIELEERADALALTSRLQ
jgi:hypothetical protein